jgi:predicted adenylyl cyclase CyaB
VCEALDAEAVAVLIQRDTYFRAHQGRLKLREEESAKAHLIAYERPSQAGQRESRYRIVTVEKADELKAALAATLGIEVVVAKERCLFIWEDVRIHLDRVDDLGHFIEFEAVTASDGSNISSAEKRVETLRQAFGIDDADLVGGSYCDLALPSRGA